MAYLPGCVLLPNSTIYSTPVFTSWVYNYTTTTQTYPAQTATILAYETDCVIPIGRRTDGLDPRQFTKSCYYGTTTYTYTTVTTYPAFTTEYAWITSLPVTITESPVPIQTLYISSCTSSSSSSTTSFNSTSTTSPISSSSWNSTSSSTSISTNSSTIISTSSTTSRTSLTSTHTSSNSTSISSTRSSSSTSVRTSTSTASPPSSRSSASSRSSRSSSSRSTPSTSPSSHSSSRTLTTSPSHTLTHTSFTFISTRTRPTISPHSTLPRETHSPSQSRTRTRLTISHRSSSRPVTHTASRSASHSTESNVSSPLLPISSRASERPTSARTRPSVISQSRPLTGTVTHASFATVLAESASEAEATTDGSQVFQPFIATRSIDRTAQTRRTRSRARPQTQTVAQAAATETNDENTPAANSRPATAQHTPNQSQQHETADQATPDDRPTAHSERPNNTAQPTHRQTNVNTPQRTPPATDQVTPQASRSLPQVTTVQPSTPAASTPAASPPAQTPATTTGGIVTNNQATDDHRRKPNVGAIVGGTIGALAFIAFLSVVAYKYVKTHSPSSGNGGERGREEEAAVTQSLMGDFFHQGLFGGAAGGVGGQGAGAGKGGAGNKQAGPGGAQGGDGPYDPEMSEVYNNAPPSTGNELGPASQHPQTAGPSTFGDNGAYSTGAPSGHPVGGYGAGGAEGVAHGHGAGGGAHGNVAPNAGGGDGSYGNVAPGAGGGGAGGGTGHVVGPGGGGGGAGTAGAGGGGGGGGAANAPTAPPGSGASGGPVGTDVSTGLNPTQGVVPPTGGDIPASAAGGHHGPGFIPVIVPLGMRKRPAASQTSLINTLPTPYLMTSTATYGESGYPAGAASSTSLMGGNNSGNERSSTDANSRRYSLSDGLYGGPAYGRYEDPFEEEERSELLPSYEARPGASGAARRNEKGYR